MPRKSERDELALILVNGQRARYFLPPRTTTEHCSTSCWAEVDAILAAGYRKPKQATTAEELDALPKRSVIRDDFGGVFQRQTKFVWTRQNRDFDYEADDIELPATVLYEPETLP